ncbi:MAG: cache domain-containing protein, partial [Solimonas sp.]
MRTVLRHSLPVVGVVAVVILVAAIAYFVYDSNRRGAVTLSNDLITAIDRRVAVQMHSYLAPAQQFLELADAAAAGRGVFEGGREVEQFALHALGTITPVTAFSYADPEGNFLFVIRNAKGGLDTKTVDRRKGNPVVTWTRRDADGTVLAEEEDPNDTFDPRTRPWYKGAEDTKKPFWSDTYLFFTLKKPGITFSIPHYDAEGKLATVMGVDIELATLSTFLKQLGVGISGRALIIDRNGRIVAYPSDDWMPAERPDAKAPMLDELGDPVLTRTFNRLRVEGYGRKVLEFADKRIIVSSEPVRMMADRNWVV